VELSPPARVILGSPDIIANTVARTQNDPKQRWMLERSQAVRQDFLDKVVEKGGSEERWMLLQSDKIRLSYVKHVLEAAKKPDRPAMWLLQQPLEVRKSYIEAVLDTKPKPKPKSS
jgi:hypothetical protein